MSEKIKIVYTTDGVLNICKECGEEVKSFNHKCNPFNKMVGLIDLKEKKE